MMADALEQKLAAHPTVFRTMERVLAFLEANKWGEIRLIIKNGRIQFMRIEETVKIEHD